MGFFSDPEPQGVSHSEVRIRVEAARRDGEAKGRRDATREAEKRIAQLVMSVYGLTEKYPDTEEERDGTRPIHPMYPGLTETYTYTVKTPGWGKLLADLRAVANAQDVAAASARLGVKR